MVVRWCSSLFLAVLAAHCCLHGLGDAAVISIDFGSEWIKVALVKPGVPMEIVLNKESKRKTAAVVSLRNNERLFGDPALNTAVKYPKSAYRYLQLLVGQKFDSPIVEKYRKWFPFYDLRKDEERGTVAFQHDEDTIYTVEELIGMMLNNSRHVAEAYAGVPIRDTVITVPPFFSQAQRRDMIRSATLVGLNVLQLMSDNAAAALNYGLFRQASFNTTPQYIMFYDMGAASTTATIVEYRKVQVKEGTLANVHPQLTVKGTGYNLLLGGLEMDISLQQHLAKLFESQKKTTGSVYDSPRAMAKLLKEAKRLKQVLSANTDHYAQIEGLLEDVDFRAKVTRKEFEGLCSDLLEQVSDPVEQALQSADMTMDEIDSVILVGGSTRVPMVQDLLLKTVNKPELGKSLNTDEAIALGAVYQGAGHTKLFRVKKFIVKEGTLFPIQVSFSRVMTQRSSHEGKDGERVEEEEEEVIKTVKRTLFQRSNPFPAKKVLTFNRHSTDFSFQIFYGDLDFLSSEEKSYLGRLNISEVYLAGVGAALSQHPQGEAKGIKAHFNMDESGLLNLTFVESVFEYPEDMEEQSTLSKIGSSISSFFGMGGDDSPKEDPPSEGEEVAADGNETETQTEEQEAPSADDTDKDPNKEAQDDTTDTMSEKQAQDDMAETKTETEPDSESVAEEVEPEVDTTDDVDSIPEESAEEEVEEPTEEVAESEEPESEKEEEVGSEEEEEAGSGDEERERPSETTPGAESEDSNTTTPSFNLTNGTNATNGTGKKSKDAPKGSVVKVNLTAEVTVLDLPSPSLAATTVAVEKLVRLYEIDQDKVANAHARNSLESHVFETKDTMYSDAVVAVSTEEQREEITAALSEAADWLEEDGYTAETKVYKDKLKALRRVSRALFKRVSEAEKRPKLLANFASSLNISHDFLARMKNLSSEVQIFTEVEITSLEKLIDEAELWITKKLADQKVTPPHDEPAILSYELEEETKKLDREIMYLLNKLRSHPPPKLKTPTNKTNATTGNQTKSDNTTRPEEPFAQPTSDAFEGTTPIREEAVPTEETTPTEEPISEPLELEGSEPLDSEAGQQESMEEEPHQEL